MSNPDLERLRGIKTFPSLVKYLREDLDWPIEPEDFEDLTFDFEPEELGIDPKTSAKIKSISQLRPLTSNQPWGIFFLNFEPKKLPVVALRRILGQLVIKKRASANRADQQTWKLSDLLFISNYGENEQRQITFAHFSDNGDSKHLPTLKVLGWDDSDTTLHMDYVQATFRKKLRWPDDKNNLDAWREEWSSAFTLRHRQVIDTSRELAVKLAGLAQKIRKRANAILSIETENGPLRKLMKGFKEALIHDLTEDAFADMYAQTIAYGLLSARITNPKGDNPDELSSQMPITNPFLKELMETFLSVGGRNGEAGIGIDFDELGINEVVGLLDNSDMEAVVRDFGDKNPLEDPVIHFYELFLHEYDSETRMDRGVFYTPRPVVSFIVRSVDELLRTEFGLEDGLADTTTWGEMVKRNKDFKIPKSVKTDTPFVQILDPSTGTGTFLVEVIELIHKTMVGKWDHEGHDEKMIEEKWNNYVPNDLLPRLHGYELLMAPYAIAHMKIGLKLYETSYRFGSKERTRIYLTNTLEPAQDFSDRFAFAIPALAQEAKAVSEIKLNKNFTAIIGNPPYSTHNENRNPTVENRKPTFIGELIDAYYYINEQPLNERNSKNIKADENKFIRFAEHCIVNSGAGILGYISANGYLDGMTMRGMRWHLLQSFNRISILDLHGSVKRDVTTPDGSKDENVFDIQQGVAVALMHKVPETKKEFFHMDLWGLRQTSNNSIGKYEWLLANTILKVKSRYNPKNEKYLFVPRDTEGKEEFDSNFFALKEILPITNTGFKTHRDHFAVSFETQNIEDRIRDFVENNLSNEELNKKHSIKDTNDWKIDLARSTARNLQDWKVHIQRCQYRPFDYRYCYLSPVAMDRPRGQIMRHLLNLPNIALITTVAQSQNNENWEHLFATDTIIECCAISNKTREINYLFPLYLYPLDTETEIRPNLNSWFANKLAEKMELRYDSGIKISQTDMGFPGSRGPEQMALGLTDAHIRPRGQAKTFGPRDVFDFIYAVLNSQSYRMRYADFLKSDFPRIPLPDSKDLFRLLGALGHKLIALHLLDEREAKSLAKPKIHFIRKGQAQVKKGFPIYDNGKIMINPSCYFEDVKPDVWNFHIGAYQVCEKWLKDRAGKGGKNPHSGRILSETDILHYRRITIAIRDTISLMAEIDDVIEEHGGWPGAFVTD
jgi:predicted helicase